MADIEAIEKLTLQAFLSTFRASLGDRPLETQLQVLVGLRRARRRPTEGVLVAVEGPALVGVMMWKTAETDTGYQSSRLRALSPLGLLGTLRFLLVTLTVYTHYRPAPEEAYFYGLAVAPAYRRQGTGRALMQRAEGEARRAGKTLICSFIASQNLASRALCKELGHREVHVRKLPVRGLVLGEPEIIRVEKALSSLRYRQANTDHRE
jgi:GNAT superfamily N-acetyltransferase